MSYEISEWSSDVHGDVYVVERSVQGAADAAVELAMKGASAQITHPSWGGYVSTYATAEGWAVAAKHFSGCDEFGFGGQIPDDAHGLCDAIAAEFLCEEFEA